MNNLVHLFWTIQWGELEINSYATDNRSILIEAKTVGGKIIWTKTIDVTKGDSDLISCSWLEQKPTEEKPFLVVGTYGEHHRGASVHLKSFTKFSKNGTIIP